MDKLEKQISSTDLQIAQYNGDGVSLESQRKQMVNTLEVISHNFHEDF